MLHTLSTHVRAGKTSQPSARRTFAKSASKTTDKGKKKITTEQVKDLSGQRESPEVLSYTGNPLLHKDNGEAHVYPSYSLKKKKENDRFQDEPLIRDSLEDAGDVPKLLMSPVFLENPAEDYMQSIMS